MPDARLDQCVVLSVVFDAPVGELAEVVARTKDAMDLTAAQRLGRTLLLGTTPPGESSTVATKVHDDLPDSSFLL